MEIAQYYVKLHRRTETQEWRGYDDLWWTETNLGVGPWCYNLYKKNRPTQRL